MLKTKDLQIAMVYFIPTRHYNLLKYKGVKQNINY